MSEELREGDEEPIYFTVSLGGKYYLHSWAQRDSMEVPAWLAYWLRESSWDISDTGELAGTVGNDLVTIYPKESRFTYVKDFRSKELKDRDTFTYMSGDNMGIRAEPMNILLPAMYKRIEIENDIWANERFALVQNHNDLWAIYDIRKRLFIAPFEFKRIYFEQCCGFFRGATENAYYMLDLQGEKLAY